MSQAGKYISKLINQGEHNQLDFKYAVSDSKKIARSIAAFANTIGGRLLIGVKDNGQIVGVYSEEEYYMIEGAAELYCKPPVLFESKEWNINGKTVLEIIIKPSTKKPHKAPDKTGKLRTYIRVKDQNLLANNILIRVWNREKHAANTFLPLKEPEKILLDYLNTYTQITKSKYCRIAQISNYIAEKILVNLISAGILKMEFTEKAVYYQLKKEGDSIFKM